VRVKIEWHVTRTIDSIDITLYYYGQSPEEDWMYEFNKIIHSEGVSVPGGHFEIEFFVKSEIEQTDMYELR
jgi:hypothetical protein